MSVWMVIGVVGFTKVHGVGIGWGWLWIERGAIFVAVALVATGGGNVSSVEIVFSGDEQEEAEEDRGGACVQNKKAMELEQVLHMKGGEGEHSYYNNSSYQKYVILKARPIFEEAVTKLCSESLPEDCFRMVDMGCSSGPNTLLPLSQIVETMDSTCRTLNPGKAPALQFFLNDLPGNDFNTIFRSLLPNFHGKLEKFNKLGPCFVAAMPGSFHGRLFPDNYLHFAHSSFSLHFLSQVPEGLVSESGMPLNKGNICMAKTSPPSVHKALLEQFEKDFTSFLASRSLEMISGGRMVLHTMGRSDQNPACKNGIELWELAGETLKDMVDEGRIEESILDSYNIPAYCPSAQEVRQLIERDGSFNIARFEEFDIKWDASIGDYGPELVSDNRAKGKLVSNHMRAISEPLLASQFGCAIMDDLFDRVSLKYADYLEKGIGMVHNLVISLVKK
ncbi:hypothetical protein Tsubulata_004006 [Turnera subulata]|uniref:Uncharacterized protein n=1 Tax=Turnera subulata TaxID=218843 RepID=A0A9Q0J951_9ROSI|nr:hypothetical protein Tsubulata_004006 [Turnera subulata]